MKGPARIFLLILVLVLFIAGIVQWYTLVIGGAYFEHASFLGSALVILLPAAGLFLLGWIFLRLLRTPIH